MVAAVVQARMSSQRLPGKVLRPLAGKPALDYLLERLSHAESIEQVIVATSDDASDDAVAEHAAGAGIECHRGPLDDVAERFRQVVERFGLGAFVRVSGDSPLLDQELVDASVARFAEGDHDVVTNVSPPTYPPGQSVEVVSGPAFERACAEIADPYDREHVTPYLYARADEFRISNFTREPPERDVRLVLDDEDDAARLEAILGRMERPHWTYREAEVVELARTVG